MLQFIKRGTSVSQPIGDLPLWLSTLLRNRGVDTPEKAERFLHPGLEQLYDPCQMQGMEKAVKLIRRAIDQGDAIIVYGDYDVDGVCATSIMLETLWEMGGKADFRIPSRHGEGYGLNCDAVREMAQHYKLLITVDCGVTNHEEVKLAQLLGMTVIVTDHHQLADTPSPANVVLNPLMGEYPFRRLCGAGVALKLTQALLGIDAVKRRIDLAALATVADLVPLIDENRVIVKEGLKVLDSACCPGIRALLKVSEITPPVSAGQVAFRLAPRINAGGRLEDASQGVTLLTCQDVQLAERIAGHLEDSNRQRQAIEQEMTTAALAAIPSSMDFYDDRIIIVEGEGWNHGVIGLAAGRICERYHFPTIVLTCQDGIAVGSCRSIPGVNIHTMLSACKDLFIRFGGHEQAAGLTMKAELIPELRRRMNLVIRENCDPSCFIPLKEYDLSIKLEDMNLELIEQLEMLQPTGYGNPAPVFLLRDGHVQVMRRVGRDGQHLKLSLLDGSSVRDGIAFSQGDLAESGMERVDAVFVPEKNEFMGRVKAQLQVQAMRPAEGSAPLPSSEVVFQALLQEMTLLAAKEIQIPPVVPVITEAAVRQLMKSGRGVLLLCHSRRQAAAFVQAGMADVTAGYVRDERAFNTVLCAPDVEKLTDVWHEIVLLDGDLLPGEAAAIQEKCPRAHLTQLRPNPAMKDFLRTLAMDDDTLRCIYRQLMTNERWTPGALAEAAGLGVPQVLTALMAFSQVKLVNFSMDPYWYERLPPVKCRMDDSPLVRYLRGAYQGS